MRMPLISTAAAARQGRAWRRFGPRLLLLLVAAAAAVAAAAGTAAPRLAGDDGPAPAPSLGRDQLGYAIGMDVAFSVAQANADMDRQAFRQSLLAALAGRPSTLPPAEIPAVAKALLTRLEIRRGRASGPMPPLSPVQAGQLLGRQVGAKLQPVARQFDEAEMVRAIDDVLDGRPTRLSPSEASALLQSFATQRSAAQAGESGRGAADFLAGNRQAPGVHVTASGLQYKVLRQGAGPAIGLDQSVRVNYAGRFVDGHVFDSSYARQQPVVVTPRGAIPGFAEGLARMPVGGKYRFWIPPALAYGASGTPGGPIPPNSLLVFDVEVLGKAESPGNPD
jgi:FKBP-type peptidyl-prolyl cis-trans isomerase FkpA